MSKRKAKRQLERWWRYIEHYMGDQFLVPPGMLRANRRR